MGKEPEQPVKVNTTNITPVTTRSLPDNKPGSFMNFIFGPLRRPVPSCRWKPCSSLRLHIVHFRRTHVLACHRLCPIEYPPIELEQLFHHPCFAGLQERHTRPPPCSRFSARKGIGGILQILLDFRLPAALQENPARPEERRPRARNSPAPRYKHSRR